MTITDVDIILARDPGQKLLAFAAVHFDDCFIVRDIKIIQMKGSARLISMPNRKAARRCPKCGSKNHVTSLFCDQCGNKLPPQLVRQDNRGRPLLYVDVAHPVTPEFRKKLCDAVLDEYEKEVNRSKEPGYKRPVDIDLPEITPISGSPAVTAADSHDAQ